MNGNSYWLDIETLLLFLSSRRQSGTLSANLKRFPGNAYKGHCRASITVVEGKITACSIQDPGGRVLAEGEIALNGLKKLGQLDWNWSIVTRESSSPTPPIGVQLVPRCIVPLERIDKNALPRKYWQVLMLIDGSRTARQIASLLLPSASTGGIQEIVKILTDLQQRGIIVILRQ